MTDTLHVVHARAAGSSTRTRSGSKALRTVLIECAQGAARPHGCQLRGYHKAPPNTDSS